MTEKRLTSTADVLETLADLFEANATRYRTRYDSTEPGQFLERRAHAVREDTWRCASRDIRRLAELATREEW